MKIEILYPEICNLYGDLANVRFLKQQFNNDAVFYETALNEKPKFLSEKIDLVYIGSASFEHQLVMIEKLKPFKKMIEKKIEEGRLFLVTGSTYEIFGSSITNEKGVCSACLDIFPFTTLKDYNHRHNSLFYGKYNDIEILGFKSSFSYSYPTTTPFPFFMDVVRGVGMNKEEKHDGIWKNNFFATPVLGPLLVLNPNFTKYLFSLMGYSKELIYEEACYKAFEMRLKEFKDPKTKMIIEH